MNASRRVVQTWEGIEAWWVDLSIEPAATELASLDDAERQRAARFVFERDRRRFLAAHAALRGLLAARTGRAPDTLAFVEGPYGKPALAGPGGCAFNMSHSGDLALIALADAGEIGADVEVLRPVTDAAALARHHYTHRERAELLEVEGPARDRRFLLGWTRKEACLKAIGSGLNVAPEAVDVGLSQENTRVHIAVPQGHFDVAVASFIHEPAAVLALARLIDVA